MANEVARVVLRCEDAKETEILGNPSHTICEFNVNFEAY